MCAVIFFIKRQLPVSENLRLFHAKRAEAFLLTGVAVSGVKVLITSVKSGFYSGQYRGFVTGIKSAAA
ncbi:MAG: hypothetical protein BA863_10050 [Desulfovibrio sp. S3730MH75]|nr:MAG: hypothetical protein BA863_10050 [Desulfovibrio sp. S3730MH75]